MADLKIPTIQLDALPLIDASQIGNPGEMEVIGGLVSKYWSPTATGINDIPMTLDPEWTMFPRLRLLSAWLDVRGCSVFQLVVTRNVLDITQDNVHGIGIYPQYLNAAGVAGRTGDAGVQTQTQMGSFTTVAKPAGPAYPWRNTFGYQLNLAPINPTTNRTTLAGNTVRLWFTETSGAFRPNERFSLEIYGQSGPVTHWP